ncbi:MAG: hypothetical protein U0L56_08690 [Lachnospiraceae bacterium]|nr:hypothetical protein [Lachnospiraceae bacterium]
MALVKCSECGADVSEKASICPKCGCPLDITKQVILETQKKKNKKIIIVVASILAVLILVVVGMFVVNYYNNPSNIAIRLVKKDFGNNIEVENIYYNSEVNGCLIKFSVDGEENTATVHLEDKTVGYQSIMDEYTEKSENSTTDDEKKQYAEELIEYMEVYDIFWEYNILMYGTEESGWEKIK